jgi:hypothetical protein
MESHKRRVALLARIVPALAIILGLSAVAASAAGPTSSSRATGELKLVGEPALIDTNVGQGAGDTLEHYHAVIRVKSTFYDTQDVTVKFIVMQGAKVIKSQTATAGIRPGGGVVASDFVLPKKGKRTVQAQFSSFKPAAVDDALVAAKIVGKPTFIHRQFGGCSMATQLKNPSADPLLEADVYLVALRNGKIVAEGESSVFDAVRPGHSVPMKVDFITCQKVGVVLAYVEGNGEF